MELRAQPAGGYRYLTGISAYSSGVIAEPGHEIVHAVLQAPLLLADGFALIDRHLAAEGRPRQALCAMQLRSPAPFSFAGFAAFNRGYGDTLADWQLLVDSDNPMARTNVAPVVRPPAEPSVHAFSYTVPGEPGRPTFIVAGAGEVVRQSLDSEAIVREGETSDDAMREKAAHVMAVMAARLDGLGVGWPDVTASAVYTAWPLQPFLATTLLEPMGPAAAHGVNWTLSLPPIAGLEFEMGLRGVRRELRLAAAGG